ncbi:MAG: hypothetical protein Q7S14_00210 [bacterium]|nr:hypothetical protein [bacterium]
MQEDVEMATEGSRRQPFVVYGSLDLDQRDARDLAAGVRVHDIRIIHDGEVTQPYEGKTASVRSTIGELFDDPASLTIVGGSALLVIGTAIFVIVSTVK